MTATVLQAYRFALDPTPRQRRVLASHCGAARYAYNWGLQLVQERLEQRRISEDVEVPWTLPALRWEWNRAKHQVAPWWAENSKEAYSSGLDGLARALKNSRNPRLATARGAEWASLAPSARAAAGTPAASPLDRFGRRLTASCGG
jgi:putative transposase